MGAGGGGPIGHMDSVSQRRMAYFCQEGMFVLLMIKFPSPQITVEQILTCLESHKVFQHGFEI